MEVTDEVPEVLTACDVDARRGLEIRPPPPGVVFFRFADEGVEQM